MTATLQTVIGVHVSASDDVKDVYVRLPVSTKTTTADVIKNLVSTYFGGEQSGKFALYEAEYIKTEHNVEFVAAADYVAKSDEELMFLRGERVLLIKKVSDTVWFGECEGLQGTFPANKVKPAEKQRMEDNTTRVTIRALPDSEIPLFVQYNWKTQKGNDNRTFLFKERDVEVRENATKDMYANLSVAKLENLLADLDVKEKRAIEEITAKYEAQLSGYRMALFEAKKHAQ